jgi:hypothetical protein
MTIERVCASLHRLALYAVGAALGLGVTTGATVGPDGAALGCKSLSLKVDAIVGAPVVMAVGMAVGASPLAVYTE